MRLLVIIADDILINSSANLCHLAYIKGMIESGNTVDLICAKSRVERDPSMRIPNSIQVYFYDRTSLYEKLSSASKRHSKNMTLSVNFSNKDNAEIKKNNSIPRRVMKNFKKRIRSLYGVHGFNNAFVARAIKYRSNVKYDVVFSFSSPPASHLLAYKLLKKNHIYANHWIQIWEDPWKSDLYSKKSNMCRIANEENRLLTYAEKICYVTPLTLINQQKLYPQNAEKMFWLPLPTYYQTVENENSPDNRLVLGYFGDYYPFARNLRPFYDTAVKTGVETYICGNPSNLFLETETVKIFPRLSVAELKEYEDRVNTLVFVCNLGGGQVPGKIYQYSTTKKRILFILDGSEEEQRILYEYFSKFHRYYFCKNNVKSISEAMKKIIANDKSILNYPVDYFEPKNIAKKLLEKVE